MPHPASFVIVGMAGFFAAAAKTPFSTLVIVSEMTGNYNLLLPTLWVCALAFLLSDEQSIYSSQVESRSRSPAHQGDYVRDVLTGLQRRASSSRRASEVPGAAPGDRLRTSSNGSSSTPYHGPAGHRRGRPAAGHRDARGGASWRRNRRTCGALVVAADLMRTDVTPLHPDDRLDWALELFVENDLLALPVVDEQRPERRVVGIVKRADVSSTYLRYVQGMNGSTDTTATHA